MWSAPPVPEAAQQIVEQARGGADFAELANEKSDIEADNGGEMGWLNPAQQTSEHRQPIFELEAGEVSDPVYGPGGYRITDYLRLGIPLNVLVLVMGSVFIPVFWPF